MKKLTEYQAAKFQLKQIGIECRKYYKTDLPAWRQVINDSCDIICKNYRFSDYYRNLLSNYSCSLHPKTK
jgi:hypothetical protein